MVRENWQTGVWLAGLALGVTVLNAAKPLTVDDPYYHFCAEHPTHAPLDPYGFRLPDGRTGMESLAPLALPYWLAGTMVLAGDSAWVCKLSLFPFVLVTLVVPIALLSAPRTRRFGIYFVIGMVLTALVVIGVASLVAYFMVRSGR